MGINGNPNPGIVEPPRFAGIPLIQNNKGNSGFPDPGNAMGLEIPWIVGLGLWGRFRKI